MEEFEAPKRRIPEAYWSFETGAPFECCIVCEKNLTRPDTPYVIEKAYIGEEVVFEYAVCLLCCENLCREFSIESRDRMEAFWRDNIRSWPRNSSCCIVTGHPARECEEYQVVVFCNGPFMLTDRPPIMISGAAADRLQDLLSPRTRDSLDRFIGDYLALPPAARRPCLVLG